MQTTDFLPFIRKSSVLYSFLQKKEKKLLRNMYTMYKIIKTTCMANVSSPPIYINKNKTISYYQSHIIVGKPIRLKYPLLFNYLTETIGNTIKLLSFATLLASL